MTENFRFQDKKHIHFIGAGGVNMSALALVMKDKGYTVTGSDSAHSALTQTLEDAGIPMTYGHFAENVHGADLVVYTAAIHEDNPERMEVKRLGIDNVERSEFLGELMKAYKFPCCIAGTHGKTTTTSMAGLVMLDAQRDPTIMVGGVMKELNGNLRIGKSDCFVAEACEYVESFLDFYPQTAIILNVEEDHLDYFTGIDHIISAFHKFCALVPNDGLVITNGEDKNALKATENLDCTVLTFGLHEGCDAYAEDIVFDNHNLPTYTLIYKGKEMGEISLSVPGKHNVLNSLSVALYALENGVSMESLQYSLHRFTGTGRRFEHRGTYKGALLMDDYAHHPTEIKTTMESASNMDGRKVTVVFQSHTYTRTHALLQEFSECFDLADEIIVTDIYAAREPDTGLVSPMDLVEKIKARGKDAKYIKTFEEIADYLKSIASPDKLFITVGAGTVFKVLDFMKE